MIWCLLLPASATTGESFPCHTRYMQSFTSGIRWLAPGTKRSPSVPGFEPRLQCAPKIRSSRKGPINVCILIKHENYRWSNSVWQPVSISKVSVSKKHGFTFIRNKIYLVWNLLRLFSSTDIYYVLNHEKFLSFLTKHKHHVEINARKEANG